MTNIKNDDIQIIIQNKINKAVTNRTLNHSFFLIPIGLNPTLFQIAG